MDEPSIDQLSETIGANAGRVGSCAAIKTSRERNHMTDVEKSTRRFAWIDCDSGAQTSLPVTPDLVRAMTYSGRHDQTQHRSIYRVHGWNRKLRREVGVGYIVLRMWNDRGLHYANPRPLAFISGLNRATLKLAKLIDRFHDIASAHVVMPQFASLVFDCRERGVNDARFVDRLLYPIRSNGDAIKQSRQKFSAAMYSRYRQWILLRRLTHAEVEHLLKEKSGAPAKLTPSRLQALKVMKRSH